MVDSHTGMKGCMKGKPWAESCVKRNKRSRQLYLVLCAQAARRLWIPDGKFSNLPRGREWGAKARGRAALLLPLCCISVLRGMLLFDSRF